jgi:hypothetical protein
VAKARRAAKAAASSEPKHARAINAHPAQNAVSAMAHASDGRPRPRRWITPPLGTQRPLCSTTTANRARTVHPVVASVENVESVVKAGVSAASAVRAAHRAPKSQWKTVSTRQARPRQR